MVRPRESLPAVASPLRYMPTACGPLRHARSVVLPHGAAGEVRPHDVVEPPAVARAYRVAGEEALAAEGRVQLPQLRDGGGELHERLVGVVPVRPRDLVVLGVGVV